jgi:hypothetical protein
LGCRVRRDATGADALCSQHAHPSAEERACYRRAFDAARQCAPEGYHLKYSGRAKGDFFLGLLRVTSEDDPSGTGSAWHAAE